MLKQKRPSKFRNERKQFGLEFHLQLFIYTICTKHLIFWVGGSGWYLPYCTKFGNNFNTYGQNSKQNIMIKFEYSYGETIEKMIREDYIRQRAQNAVGNFDMSTGVS